MHGHGTGTKQMHRSAQSTSYMQSPSYNYAPQTGYGQTAPYNQQQYGYGYTRTSAVGPQTSFIGGGNTREVSHPTRVMHALIRPTNPYIPAPQTGHGQVAALSQQQYGHGYTRNSAAGLQSSFRGGGHTPANLQDFSTQQGIYTEPQSYYQEASQYPQPAGFDSIAY